MEKYMKNNLLRLVKLSEDELGNSFDNQYSQLKTHYDEKYKAGWYYMNALPRPCFTSLLLDEISDYQQRVKLEMKNSSQEKYNFLIAASDVEGVFNLGGDLAVFLELIRKQDKKSLLNYAIKCINALYQNMIHLDSELTTIALVQGDALGGGFEGALSSNVLIAERGTKLGLPEVLFNLFPGMGAYSLLSRKVSAAKAEEIILSGKLYLAEELYELGIVDILADKGEGEVAVYQYINSSNRKANSYQAIRKVKDVCNAIPYKELLDITKIWVDSALKLTDKDLKMMERLVMRQTAKSKV
jgi:DSF synthase